MQKMQFLIPYELAVIREGIHIELLLLHLQYK